MSAFPAPVSLRTRLSITPTKLTMTFNETLMPGCDQ